MLTAAIRACCTAQVTSIWDWVGLLRPSALLHLAPAAASTAATMWVMRHARHPLALPGVLVVIPALFHLVRLAGRWSMEDAQRHGWLTKGPVRSHACLLLGIASSALPA